MVKKTNKLRACRLKIDSKRTKYKIFELSILELKIELAILEDSKVELQERLDKENQKLSNVQQKIRDVRR